MATTSDLFCLPDDLDYSTAEAEDTSDTVSAGRKQPAAGDSSTSGSHGPAQQNAVLPGLEKQTFAMLDHPDVDIGMPSPPQRIEGGFGPRRPLLRGLEVVPRKGEES
jgi:hypothetical protein